MVNRMNFGIESLDELFGEGPNFGIEIPRGEATSFCLIGPDGTGKSVFALHLADDYLKKNSSVANTKVLYVSTDLRYAMAVKMAASFGLKAPECLQTADYKELADFFLRRDCPT